MNTAAALERGISPGRSKRRHKRASRSDRRTSQTARKDDLWFRGDSFWPGALWRIPGLEVPQIEAEMRAAAASNITRKFVDRLVASPRTRRRARSEPSKPGTVGWRLAEPLYRVTD